jgi:hypothetical protein
MKSSRIATLFVVAGISARFGCLGAGAADSPIAQPKSAHHGPVDATVRISSTPSGALVLICPGEEFHEDAAVPLGKTPLLRLLPLTESNASIRITKAGYQVWNDKLSPDAPEIKAELAQLTEDEKQKLGWFVSPPCYRLTVVPIRLGIKKVGSKAEGFETSSDATNFTSRFLTAFETTIKQRFGSQAELATPTNLVSDAVWQELARQVEGINIATVGFTPTPRRLDFTAGENASLADLDGAVLLVRAEAHYMGKGAIFARAAIPILLAAGSAAGGIAVAQSTGASFYTYTAFGAAPSSDVIMVQMFLVHSSTRELMWYGQVIMPQFYKHEQVTERTATKAAEQIPAAFLEKN